VAKALYHSFKQGERGRLSGHEGLQASSATQKESKTHSKKLTCKFFISEKKGILFLWAKKKREILVGMLVGLIFILMSLSWVTVGEPWGVVD